MEFLVGTGGYGDPLERDPQVVIEDLADDYVSVERAKKDYGIVVRVVDEDMGEYEIDADETKTGAGLHPCQS
jgi:N-methylhydantoinase B